MKNNQLPTKNRRLWCVSDKCAKMKIEIIFEEEQHKMEESKYKKERKKKQNGWTYCEHGRQWNCLKCLMGFKPRGLNLRMCFDVNSFICHIQRVRIEWLMYRVFPHKSHHRITKSIDKKKRKKKKLNLVWVQVLWILHSWSLKLICNINS